MADSAKLGPEGQGFLAGLRVEPEQSTAIAVGADENIAARAAVDSVDVRLDPDVPEGQTFSTQPPDQLGVGLQREPGLGGMDVRLGDKPQRPCAGTNSLTAGVDPIDTDFIL